MRYLSNKEKKNINLILWNGYNLSKKDIITEDENILFKNGEKYLIIVEKNKKEILKFIPHLRSINEESFSSVYIDSGAIPFLIKGADMMRPGIHKIENFSKGNIILVRDEKYSKILGIGEAIYDSKEMENIKKGISVKVLHYVGDNKF